MTTNKPQLRNALKKLRRIDFDRSDPANTAMAPQEMLDFLAMLAGMKPVCLIDRGFEDSAWVAGVASLASTTNLHIIRGQAWCAADEFVGLPDWYREERESDRAEGKEVLYVCRSRSVATNILAINAEGEITIEQEASLLGYPVCCVRDRRKSALG